MQLLGMFATTKDVQTIDKLQVMHGLCIFMYTCVYLVYICNKGLSILSQANYYWWSCSVCLQQQKIYKLQTMHGHVYLFIYSCMCTHKIVGTHKIFMYICTKGLRSIYGF